MRSAGVSDKHARGCVGCHPCSGQGIISGWTWSCSKHWKTIDLPNVNREKGTGNYVVFGQVVGIYINEYFIKDGLFNASAARPLVRLGYMDYGVVGSENTFSKNRPKLNKDGKLEPVDEWDGIYR